MFIHKSWLNKLWLLHTINYFATIKKNKVDLYAPTQKDVLDIMFYVILSLLKNKMNKAT